MRTVRTATLGISKGNEIWTLDLSFIMFMLFVFAPRFWADYISFLGVWVRESLNELMVPHYISGVPRKIPESQLEKGLHQYFTFYNHERPHQSLSYQAPAEVHFAGVSCPIAA